jgi:hypothetical protein
MKYFFSITFENLAAAAHVSMIQIPVAIILIIYLTVVRFIVMSYPNGTSSQPALEPHGLHVFSLQHEGAPGVYEVGR